MKIPQRIRKPLVVRLPKYLRDAMPIKSAGVGGYKLETFGLINYFFMFAFTAMLLAMIYISQTTPRSVTYIPQECLQFMSGK